MLDPLAIPSAVPASGLVTTRAALIGCVVTALGTPSMHVQVSAGTVDYDDAVVPVAAVASLVIAAAHASLDRYDSVVVSSAGVVSALTGTAGISAGPTDDAQVHIGLVKVPAAATTIVAADITSPVVVRSGAASRSTDETAYRLSKVGGPQTQLSQTKVLGGLEVTQHGGGAMSVDVSAGSVLIGNVAVSVAAVSGLTVPAADATYDRIDAVSVDSTGTVVLSAGTPGPVEPPWPSGNAPLARVTVPATAASVLTANIRDARGDLALIHTSPYRVSGTWYGPPGIAVSAGAPWASGDMYLVPYFVGKSISVQTIGCFVASAGTAGSKGRLGIYADDGAGGLSLLVDAGQVAIDVNGEAKLTISTTLTPGQWWFAIAFQSLGASKPFLSLCAPTGLSPIGASTITLIQQASPTGAKTYGGMCFTGVTAGLPAAPTSPDYTKQALPGVWVQA